MEYSIDKLAKLAGVSSRTLRYYDEISLLKPLRTNSSGYRIYGSNEVSRLQQILFFRELGVALDQVKAVLDSPDIDYTALLEQHLRQLLTKRAELDTLIGTVTKTIQNERGLIEMADKEKFEGFKKKLIEDNESSYGKEVREKYGDKAVEESNAKTMNLSREEYDAMQALGEEILSNLAAAVSESADPSGETGLKIAELHKKWLGYTWAAYNPEAHKGLVQMYIDDPRFTSFYDDKVPGCAQFLRDAVHAFCG